VGLYGVGMSIQDVLQDTAGADTAGADTAGALLGVSACLGMDSASCARRSARKTHLAAIVLLAGFWFSDSSLLLGMQRKSSDGRQP
jgi:hypothetical protein